MWLYQFINRKDGEPRWAVQRELGGPYEVIRRRSFKSFMLLAEALLEGEESLERLALKAGVSELPGELQVPTLATKVVCVGLNYRQHAEEMGKALPEEPLLFMKPTTALLPSRHNIELPESSQEVHHEGELAVVIGRRLSKVSPEEGMAGILGYTCGNDVTARDIQRREQRYTRAKGFDTFCPLGPGLRLAWPGFEPSAQELCCEVNGEVRQRSTLDDMIFGIGEVVSFVSGIMTLMPGDVILTGTPSGVGPLQSGDRVQVTISGVGVLESTVR